MSSFGFDSLDEVNTVVLNQAKRAYPLTTSSICPAEITAKYIIKKLSENGSDLDDAAIKTTMLHVSRWINELIQTAYYAQMHVSGLNLPGNFNTVVLSEWFEWVFNQVVRQVKTIDRAVYLDELATLTFDFLTAYNGGVRNSSSFELKGVVRKICRDWKG